MIWEVDAAHSHVGFSVRHLMGIGPRAGLSARTKINRKGFNLSYGAAVEAGNVALGEIVTIEIDLEATPKVEETQEAEAPAQ